MPARLAAGGRAGGGSGFPAGRGTFSARLGELPAGAGPGLRGAAHRSPPVAEAAPGSLQRLRAGGWVSAGVLRREPTDSPFSSLLEAVASQAPSASGSRAAPPPRADPPPRGTAAASPGRHHADLPEGEAGGLLAEREEDQEAEFPGLRRAVPVRRRPSPRRGERRGGRRGGWGERRPRGAAAPRWGPGRAAPGSALACTGPGAFCARWVIPLSRLCPPGPGEGRAGRCPPGAPLPARGAAAQVSRSPGRLPRTPGKLGPGRCAASLCTCVCVCEGPAQPCFTARANVSLLLPKRSLVFPVK